MQLIRLVLDDAYRAIETADDSKRDELITAEISALSSAYAELTNLKTKPIDYRDPVTRFAYIFKSLVSG
jgi:hypothetical protein